jgi:eukaryotic-like serine/threonine-protein kinase
MAAPGDLLDGRYRLGSVLGSGGMADVFRAQDQVTGEEVAVKLLRGADPSAAHWLSREEAALQRLDHPALVRLRATGLADDHPYLVLDLVEGTSLAAILEDGPLSVGRAVELGALVADALAHAHAVGVTHRDVKPANILIDASGRPHLADFGVARLSEVTTATAAGVVIGTAAYLAPEQVRAEPVGPPADVYALGLVVVESITGVRAFPGSFPESAMARLARPPAVPATLPSALRSALVAATAMQPEARPTASELADALRRPVETAATEVGAVAVGAGATVVASATQVLPAAAGPARPRSPGRRRGSLIAAGVGSVIGITVALVAVREAGSGSPSVPPPTTAPAGVPVSVAVTTVPSTLAPTTTPTTTPTTRAPPTPKGKKKPGG